MKATILFSEFDSFARTLDTMQSMAQEDYDNKRLAYNTALINKYRNSIFSLAYWLNLSDATIIKEYGDTWRNNAFYVTWAWMRKEELKEMNERLQAAIYTLSDSITLNAEELDIINHWQKKMALDN